MGLLLRVCVLSAVLACTLAVVFEHKVIYRTSFKHRMQRAGKWAEYVKIIRQRREMVKELVQAGVLASVTQGARNDWDDEYLTNVTLGTPGQYFLVQPDTGSSNLWVPGASCSGKGCNKKQKYDSSKSSTYKNDGRTWKIEYGNGDAASGTLVVDTFTLTGDTGTPSLSIPNTIFGQASIMTSSWGDQAEDGMFGLGFIANSVDDVQPPILSAIQQGLLDQPLFTVYLEHRGGMSYDVPGGVFTFGAIDTTHCGPIIAYQPLSSAQYWWQYSVAGIQIGSYSYNRRQDTISDTGTAYLGGPTAQANAIASAAGATYNSDEESYDIDCKAQPPDLIFTVGSNQYAIKAVNMIVEWDTNKCNYALFPFDDGAIGPAWIHGDPWIRQLCHVFDVGQQRVGFAPSLQDA